MTAGRRCWGQVLRVRFTLGHAGHEIAVRPDTAPAVDVAGALAAEPRTAKRYPRVQFLTIKDLFEGRELRTPTKVKAKVKSAQAGFKW